MLDVSVMSNNGKIGYDHCIKRLIDGIKGAGPLVVMHLVLRMVAMGLLIDRTFVMEALLNGVSNKKVSGALPYVPKKWTQIFTYPLPDY